MSKRKYREVSGSKRSGKKLNRLTKTRRLKKTKDILESSAKEEIMEIED